MLLTVYFRVDTFTILTRIVRYNWRLIQECFQEYIRQRVIVTDPDGHHSDRMDSVEAGDGDEDEDITFTGADKCRAFVTPYAGIGPIAASIAQRVSMCPLFYPRSITN